MSINEKKKNDKLSYKYSSHTTNLLKIPFLVEKKLNEAWGKECEKAKKAANRFHNFINKSIQKSNH